MKNKKVIMYLIVILFITFIICVGFLTIKNKTKQNNESLTEYTPLEEISEEQLRKTNIILYFEDKMTGELATEIRQIDSKTLIKNPEKKLVEFLMRGPQNDNLQKIIPDEIELLDVKLKKGILSINFLDNSLSINNLETNRQKLIIDSIEKTLLQLNEINEIKILINDEEIIF